MLIAIATNDRKNIAKRTGRASEFAFFEIKDNEIVNVSFEKNQHEHHDHDRSEGNHRQGRRGHGLGRGRGHGHSQGFHHHHHDEEEEKHSHDEVVKQLKNVDMFLVRAVGKYMRGDLERGNIPFKLVKGENITDIVKDYIKSLAES